jgi:hypothetical protein
MKNRGLVGSLLPVLAVGLVISLAQLSCGDSTDSGAPGSVASTTDVPPTLPTPVPTPTGVPTDAPRSWTAVAEVVSFCDNPSCPGGDGFMVDNSGAYTIGDGSLGSGDITPEELASLTQAADAVAAQTGLGMSCSGTVTILGASQYQLAMAYDDQTTQMIISVDDKQSCYYGDQPTDVALHEQMRKLEQEYDPRGQGASGPAMRMAPGPSG